MDLTESEGAEMTSRQRGPNYSSVSDARTVLSTNRGEN